LPALAIPARRREDGQYLFRHFLKDFSIAVRASDILEITVSPTPPAPGLSLTFSISTASYTPVITTNRQWCGGIDFASTVVGPVTVNVYNGPIIPANLVATQVLNFIAVPGPVDLANSYLTVIQNPANADGVSQDIVEAVLYDQYGNAEPSGTPITFSIESGTASMTASGVSSGNVATAYFTSTVVGSVQVQG